MNLAQHLREALATVDDASPVTDSERARHAELIERAREREAQQEQAALPLRDERDA